MALNRETLRNDPRRTSPQAAGLADQFWGFTEWREEFYQPGQIDLFGNIEEYKIVPTTARRLGERFQKRLHEIFPCVSDIAVIRNATGQPIYCLLFAGPNANGVKIATDILHKIGEPLTEWTIRPGSRT